MKKLLLTMIGALLAFAANAADWYLCGSALNNGSGSWADAAAYKFTPSASDANIQTFSIASISGNIKIKEKGTWSTSFGTNGSKLKEGVEYKAGTDTDNIPIDGTINDATITINISAHTVKITGKGAENDYSNVYLVGDFGSGWNEALTTYPLNLKAGTQNVWEGSFTLNAAKSYFKMKAGSLVYGTGGADVAVELDKTYTAAQSGNAYSIAAGKYNFSFVLDKNADTGKLTVTQDGPISYPESLYVVGNIKNSDFLPNVTEPLPAASEAGHYEGDITFTGTFGTGFSYFSLATATGSSATDWAGLGTRYGAAEENLLIGTEPVELTDKINNSWKLADGTYTLKVNLVDKTMTVVKKDDPLPPTPPTPVEQPLEVTFDFTSYDGLCAITPAPAPLADWSNDGSAGTFFNMVDCDFSKDNVVMHVAKGTATQTNQYPRYYRTTAGVFTYRINKTNLATLTAPEGYEFSEVVFSTTGKNSVISSLALIENTLGKFTNNSTDKTTTWTKPENGGVSVIKFNCTTNSQVSTIKVTLEKAGVEPPAPEYPVLYFRGAQNNNAADDASLFTQTDGIYTLSLAKLNGNFKIADAEWGAQFSTKNTAMALGTEYAVEDAAGMGGDMAIEGAAKEVTITFDYKAMKLKVEGTPFTPEVGYQINSSLTVETWSKADMVKTDEGKWEYVVIPVNATGEMQVIRTEDGTAKDYLGSTAAEISEANPSVTMAVGQANLKYSLTAGSEYKFTFDPETYTLTVAPTTEPITYPVLYFRGGNTEWGATEASRMTETDGIYTFTLDKLNAEFKIAAEDWDEASFSTKNLAMELGTEYDVTSVIMQENANMGMAKNIINATVTFDYKAMTLKVEGMVDETPEVITYIIKGTFTEPAWDAKEMVKNDIDQTWSYTGALAAETGEVLVVQLNDGVEKAWFKAPATEVLSAAKPEITVAADGAGNPKYDFAGLDVKEMTFTFDPATGALKATWTTGIEGISADFDPTAEYYNMQGLRVKAPAPGLYIVVRGTTVTKEYLK